MKIIEGVNTIKQEERILIFIPESKNYEKTQEKRFLSMNFLITLCCFKIKSLNRKWIFTSGL